MVCINVEKVLKMNCIDKIIKGLLVLFVILLMFIFMLFVRIEIMYRKVELVEIKFENCV